MFFSSQELPLRNFLVYSTFSPSGNLNFIYFTSKETALKIKLLINSQLELIIILYIFINITFLFSAFYGLRGRIRRGRKLKKGNVIFKVLKQNK